MDKIHKIRERDFKQQKRAFLSSNQALNFYLPLQRKRKWAYGGWKSPTNWEAERLLQSIMCFRTPYQLKPVFLFPYPLRQIELQGQGAKCAYKLYSDWNDFLCVVTCKPHPKWKKHQIYWSTRSMNLTFQYFFFKFFKFYCILVRISKTKIGLKYFHVKCVHETTRSTLLLGLCINQRQKLKSKKNKRKNYRNYMFKFKVENIFHD